MKAKVVLLIDAARRRAIRVAARAACSRAGLTSIQREAVVRHSLRAFAAGASAASSIATARTIARELARLEAA